MNVYIYAADLWCEECGEKLRRQIVEELVKRGNVMARDAVDSAGQMWLNIPFSTRVAILKGWLSESEHRYDSDEYPKGPYPDGGGEADAPHHCAGCGVFLENPLTDDGINYVVEACEDFLITGRGRPEIIEEWATHYSWSVFENYDEAVLSLAARKAEEVLK